MTFFQELGALVGARWKACNYDEARFPGIAEQALAEMPPDRNVTLWDLARGSVMADTLPSQGDLDARFGDPPLTVFIGRGFRIEALFWLQAVPSIHQHGFSGAFHVMRGSSIHTRWGFRPIERLETRLIIGEVSWGGAELLWRGDTRPIIAGDDMFHATFHVDRPSISIVVRTISQSDQLPQYTLDPPSIAHAKLDRLPVIRRQLQILQMLIHSGRRTEFHELVRHALATKDALSAYEILTETWKLIEDEEEREELLTLARIRQPRLLEVLRPVLVRKESRHRLLRIQRALPDPDLSFFVALLLTVPDRHAIEQLIRERFGAQHATARILKWVRQLSERGALGFKFQEPWVLMLSCLLQESSEESACRRFIEQGPPDYGLCGREDLMTLATTLRNSWLLGHLFEAPADVCRRASAFNQGEMISASAVRMPARVSDETRAIGSTIAIDEV